MHVVGMGYEKCKILVKNLKEGITWRPRHSWEYNLENGL